MAGADFCWFNFSNFFFSEQTIIKLNIFPLRAAEIDGKVNDFAHYSDEVRRNIPDLLLATMDILCSQYKEVK